MSRTSLFSRRGTDGTEGTFLGFEVGEVSYAIDIGSVREIIRPLKTLPLPHAPPSVVGVVDHRGDVVPVVDLRLRFGIAPGDAAQGRWIITIREGHLVALVVDRVTEVFGGRPEARREAPTISQGADVRAILRAYSHHDRLVFVLDPARLTAAADAVDLSSVAPGRFEGRGE